MPIAPLLETLRLAQSRLGFCAPNPAVGAVVMRDGRVVARGTHLGPGQPHAEVEALKNFTVETADTLYVSLEPCCHTGKRTPPCAPLLIERGVRHVVYAYRDPNPQVAGKGEAMLRAAGVEVTHHPLPEIDDFYVPYAHWTRTGRPAVTAKLALTLDGKIAASGGRPHPITGEALHRRTHQARREADAILTTARTVRADDPALNSRLDPAAPLTKPIYVLDARGEVSPQALILKGGAPVTLFVAATNTHTQALEKAGATVVVAPFERGRLALGAVLERIGKDGRQALWVEAGGRLFQALLEERLLQYAQLYLAPKWLGADGLNAFEGIREDLFSGAASVAWRGEGRDAVCEVRF